MIGLLERVSYTPIEPSLEIRLHRVSPAPDRGAGIGHVADVVVDVAIDTGRVALEAPAKTAPLRMFRIIQAVRQKEQPRRRVSLLDRGVRIRRGPRSRRIQCAKRAVIGANMRF